MEDEIKEKLQEFFINVKINVEYKEVRMYLVTIQFATQIKSFAYKYDANYTFTANIEVIRRLIERNILEYYRR